MRAEPQTPAQSRRMQPKQIPWRCVALDGQKMVPLQLDDALNPKEFHSYQFCVHVEDIPHCTLSDEGPNQTISRSVISSDGYVYEKSALDDYYEKGGVRNCLTMQAFSPAIQYWIRFACQGSLPSKLDPRKKFDKNNPVIGFTVKNYWEF